MKISVKYNLTVTAHEWRELVRIAREHGHDFDNKSERKLIKILLQSDGTGILASTEPETKTSRWSLEELHSMKSKCVADGDTKLAAEVQTQIDKKLTTL